MSTHKKLQLDKLNQCFNIISVTKQDPSFRYITDPMQLVGGGGGGG